MGLERVFGGRPGTLKGRGILLFFMVNMALVFVMTTLSAASSRRNTEIVVRQESGQGVQVIAHRAGAALGPENTVAALEKAIEAGAQAAEVDVQMTRDGVPVVIHDGSLKRTAGFEGTVWQTDSAILSQLDAGGWFAAQYAGERVATLEDMIDAAGDQIDLMIEVKCDGPYGSELLEKTVELIRTAGKQAEWTLACVDISLLQRSKRLAPELNTVCIGVALPENLAALDYVDGYSIQLYGLTEQGLDVARSHGKKIYAWTVNTEQEIERALALGVDGLISDDPVLALRLASEAGIEGREP